MISSFEKIKINNKDFGERLLDYRKILLNEDFHEAIISKSVWELVQKNINSHSKFKASKYDIDNIFRGKLRCEDCGRTLLVKVESKVKKPLLEKTHYECTTYRKLGSKHCTSHRIEYLEIYNVILDDIKRQAKELAK